MDVTYLDDGRPCVVLTPSDNLEELAAFIDRADRAAVYAGRLPCPGAAQLVAAARHVLALDTLVPHPEPERAADGDAPARWITTVQAAKRLSISDRAVRKRIKAGTLRGRQHGGRWFVDAKEMSHGT